MQKSKIFSLLLVIPFLTGCALFQKPQIVPVDERVFIIKDKFETRQIGSTEHVLPNPFYPSDKAIIISGEKFKKVMGISIDTILEKDIKRLDKEIAELDEKLKN